MGYSRVKSLKFRVQSFIVLAFILASCGNSEETIKNANGKLGFSINESTVSTYSPNGEQLTEVEKKEYKKIVILATPFYQIFEELGTESHVIGMSNLTRLKKVKSHIQSVGEGDIVDLEKIISLSPDLIICNSYQLENIKSLNIPKLACDEYLEMSPVGRLRFISFVSVLTNSFEIGLKKFEEKSMKFILPIKRLNTSILKLNNYGTGWFQPGCNTYISQVITLAGASPVCIEGSSKSEKISHESAILSLSKNETLLFMDWGESKKGMKDRLKSVLELDNYPSQLLYCNTTETDYFQESILNSYLIINDLHQVLKTGEKGVFFELIPLEN